MTDPTKEDYAFLKQVSKEKRSNNRSNGAALLKEAGTCFSSSNNGAHLIVEGSLGFIDYWPGTGRWASRKGLKGFGVRNLINSINNELA